ncbi:MAG TPA: hypothetical protein VFP25_07685, partial [Nitrososphaeraceae archaeon]|nr:hypothetical protein [Nitrososphaeraceae archaeon]
MEIKITSNFYTKAIIFILIIAIGIVISIVFILSIYNTLPVDGQTSSLSGIFDISECDEVINAT